LICHKLITVCCHNDMLLYRFAYTIILICRLCYLNLFIHIDLHVYLLLYIPFLTKTFSNDYIFQHLNSQHNFGLAIKTWLSIWITTTLEKPRSWMVIPWLGHIKIAMKDIPHLGISLGHVKPFQNILPTSF